MSRVYGSVMRHSCQVESKRPRIRRILPMCDTSACERLKPLIGIILTRSTCQIPPAY